MSANFLLESLKELRQPVRRLYEQGADALRIDVHARRWWKPVRAGIVTAVEGCEVATVGWLDESTE